MKKYVLALLMTFAVPTLALAEKDRSDNPDASFYKDAAEGGLAEVEAGKLAQQKGTSQAVKDFGAMMVKDHTANNTKLEALAAGKGVTLPKEPGLTHKATKKKLEILSGNTFDKSYIKGQVSGHKKMAELLQKEIDTGKDAQAKAFATETLPTVKAHLKHAEDIEASLEAAKKD